MAGLKSIELETEVRDLALVGADDSVWLVVPLRWWDFATILWWLFCPADRKTKVKLTLSDGKKSTFRAVRVSSRYIRIRGLYK